MTTSTNIAAGVDWDLARRSIADGSTTRFAAWGTIEEAGRTYRVTVSETLGGRLEPSLWLLDGKDRQDRGAHIKPHLRAAAVASYVEMRQAQRRGARAAFLAREAAEAREVR